MLKVIVDSIGSQNLKVHDSKDPGTLVNFSSFRQSPVASPAFAQCVTAISHSQSVAQNLRNETEVNCGLCPTSVLLPYLHPMLCCVHVLTTPLLLTFLFSPPGVSPSLLTGSSPLHLRSGL